MSGLHLIEIEFEQNGQKQTITPVILEMKTIRFSSTVVIRILFIFLKKRLTVTM